MSEFLQRVCFLCCALALTPLATAEEPDSGQLLSDVIENVRRNEALYADIEIKGDYTYRLADYAMKDDSLIDSESGPLHLVYQGGKVYLNESRSIITVAGSKSEASLTIAFDGREMRSVRDGQVANIRHELVRTSSMLLPHTLILENSAIDRPLSEALASGRWTDRTRINAKLVGCEMMAGLDCVKLVCETWMETSPTKKNVRYIWLATERNYLPIRSIDLGSTLL